MARKAPYVSLDVYDHNRQKLCSLYDSKSAAKGQAYNIIYTNQITGLKTISFSIPFIQDQKRNFRWNFIKSEYQLRLKIDDWTDWFIINSPKKTKSNRGITNTVTCNHLSMILKTKNLYLTFDDENGIGTLQYLMEQVLRGTGWSLGKTDIFYERDGETEKIRSISSEGKKGAYQLTTNVCNLFNAYPVFNGDTKTVDILSLNHKGKLFEIVMGKDIESLSVEFNSNDIITRMYVEGEYGEDGYVGIDDVNPTGLSYLMNFDYYDSIGMLTEEQKQAIETYYEKMLETIENIREVAIVASEKENRLNELWGQINYVIYPISSGVISGKIVGGTVKAEQLEISEGDELTLMVSDGTYRKVTARANGKVNLRTTDTYAIKFITKPSGTIGAKEVAIEAKKKLIDNLNKRITEETSDDRKADYNKKISEYLEEINEIYTGNSETAGLYSQMHEAVNLAVEVNEMNTERTAAQNKQEEIEAEFRVIMGDLLKEGYWNNDNYALGQEKFLYEDALAQMNRMAWPEIKYQVSRRSLAQQFKYRSTDIELNMQARVYDSDLGVNDIVYVSAITMYLDNPKDDTVELSNEELTITGITFDSILSRMTKLADQIDQKNSLYDRANAIRKDGSIYMERLEGQINVLKNQLSSTVSSWYTDENGNIIFEATTGKSAMMLTGDGFMIANGKLEDGTWNWRTFGTGEGFTADAITTGYLSADRIEARAITVEKLDSGVGASIDLSGNNSIKLVIEDTVDSVIEEAVAQNVIHKGPTPPENPKQNDLWLDTSGDEFDILKRFYGDSWIETTITQDDLLSIRNMISRHTQEFEIIQGEINSKVSKTEFDDGLSGKLNTDWVESVYSSNLRQTSEDITLRFTESKEYTDQFRSEVEVYQRFDINGLELGKKDDPFKVQLSNTKLSFKENDVEVAYVSNEKLYITNAQVTDSLSIGTQTNGYFDWLTEAGGLGLKWKQG